MCGIKTNNTDSDDEDIWVEMSSMFIHMITNFSTLFENSGQMWVVEKQQTNSLGKKW